MIIFRKLLVIALLLMVWPANAFGADGIIVVKIEGAINPVVAEFVANEIRSANTSSEELIVIRMDTPGGLDTSMRKIIKAIQSSKIPVASFISPLGASAVSAGTFITIASHIAVMEPGTSIGMAHPLNLISGGGEKEKLMEEKVVNDASAPSTITLRSMTISRNNNGYFLLTSSFLLLYYSCWSFITWLSKRKKKGVIITYKSIEIVESNDDSWQEFVINYIGKEYVNPDLTLNNTANYTGKPIKIVSKFIREKFNLSFNQYLNGIRLEEGKKLMKNSNLSLKEISYQIGYSGGNHFTRVFKQHEDVTPTEYLMTLN